MSAKAGDPGPRCLYCESSSRVELIGIVDEFHGVAGEFDLARCDNPRCGALLAAPMPTDDDLAGYYANYYTHEEPKRAVPLTWLVGRAPWIERCWPFPARQRELAEMAIYFGTTGNGRALEVGCGAGQRLRALEDAGWDVTGQDVDPLAGRLVEDRPNIEVLHGPLPGCAIAESTFDLVGMSHVLEHAADPAALLLECWRILRPNGRLVVIGPNASGFGAQRFGKSYLALADRTHLAIPGAESTRILAERVGIRVTASYTTAAAADQFVSGSLTPLTARSRMPAVASAARVAVSMAAQPVADAFLRFRPSTGNEIVLIAEK